jgi:hypothetical protein
MNVALTHLELGFCSDDNVRGSLLGSTILPSVPSDLIDDLNMFDGRFLAVDGLPVGLVARIFTFKSDLKIFFAKLTLDKTIEIVGKR